MNDWNYNFPQPVCYDGVFGFHLIMMYSCKSNFRMSDIQKQEALTHSRDLILGRQCTQH